MTSLINTINNADNKDIAAEEERKPKPLKDYSPKQAKTSFIWINKFKIKGIKPGIDITVISSVFMSFRYKM